MCDSRVTKTACRECPFRRDSAPGYLGEASYDPESFLAPHWHAEAPLPCHMHVDWERDAEQQDAPLCRGLMVMMRNSAKMPTDPGLVEIRNAITPDREAFFAFPHEFKQHHTKPEQENQQ